MGKNLSSFQIHTARTQVKITDRNGSSVVSILNAKKGIQRKYRRRAVCADCTITDISSNGSDIPDLRSAHLIYSFSQNRNVFLNHRVIGNMGKSSSCAYINISVFFFCDTVQFFNVTDTHKRGSCHFPFPDLNQYIASAGDHSGIRMFL